MAIFNSYVSSPEGNPSIPCGSLTIDVVRRGHKMVVSWNRGTPNPQLANIFVLKCIKTHDVILG